MDDSSTFTVSLTRIVRFSILFNFFVMNCKHRISIHLTFMSSFFKVLFIFSSFINTSKYLAAYNNSTFPTNLMVSSPLSIMKKEEWKRGIVQIVVGASVAPPKPIAIIALILQIEKLQAVKHGCKITRTTFVSFQNKVIYL